MTPQALSSHWLDELLPLWREHGVDRQQGGFVSRLDAKLAPAPDGFKRLLVQGRQIYAFSLAAQRGAGAWALETAQAGFAFLLDRFRDRRYGGWFLTITPDGKPLDRCKDLYAHAFVVLALAELYAATLDIDVLALARLSLDEICERLRDPEHGGFHEAASEDWTPVAGPRLQNPHMHLLEALLALADVDEDPSYLDEAAALVELCETRWCDARSGALCERFEPSWLPLEGTGVEPGHGFEWAWLLARYQALGGSPPPELTTRLLRFAEQHGVDADGGVFDEIEPGGGVRRESKRLWPQTERIRALAIHGHLDPMQKALDYVFAHYVDPEHRGWHEQLDPQGRVTSAYMNATSVYHISGALDAAIDALG